MPRLPPTSALPIGRIDLEMSQREAAKWFQNLVRMCEYPHRVREMLAHIRNHARTEYDAFVTAPRKVGDTSRGWEGQGAAAVRDRGARAVATYFDWCRKNKRKVGAGIDAFCSEFNRDRELNLIHHFLDYKAGATRPVSAAQKGRLRTRVAGQMRRARADESVRKLLLTEAGCKPKHPLSGKQLRRLLVDYATGPRFREQTNQRLSRTPPGEQLTQLAAWLSTSGEAKRRKG